MDREMHKKAHKHWTSSDVLLEIRSEESQNLNREMTMGQWHSADILERLEGGP